MYWSLHVVETQFQGVRPRLVEERDDFVKINSVIEIKGQSVEGAQAILTQHRERFERVIEQMNRGINAAEKLAEGWQGNPLLNISISGHVDIESPMQEVSPYRLSISVEQAPQILYAHDTAGNQTEPVPQGISTSVEPPK